MFDEINLALKKETHSREEQIKKLRIISLASLVLVAIFSVLMFLINLSLSTNSIKKEQDATSQSLTPYSDTIAKIYLLNSRLSDIGKILDTRKDYSKDVDKIIALVGGDSRVIDLEVKHSNLVLVISSPSLKSLNEFLNEVLDLHEKGMIGNVQLTNLSNQESSFSLGLTINLL